jgi:hypothetical protein
LRHIDKPGEALKVKNEARKDEKTGKITGWDALFKHVDSANE